MTRTLPLLVAALLLSACGTTADKAAVTSPTLRCTKASGGLTFAYTLQNNNGDGNATCSITSGGTTTSNSNVCPNGSVAPLTGEACATYGPCSVNYDVDTASGGAWTFSDSASGYKAVYHDTGSASDGTTVLFASGDCTTS